MKRTLHILILTMALTVARGQGIFMGFDTNAVQFLVASGVTNDMGRMTAVNSLVVSLKSAGLWTNLYAVYPFVAGTTNGDAVNLVNTNLYTILWNGVLATNYTHTYWGITNSGGDYGDTQFRATNYGTIYSTNAASLTVHGISGSATPFMSLGAVTGWGQNDIGYALVIGYIYPSSVWKCQFGHMKWYNGSAVALNYGAYATSSGVNPGAAFWGTVSRNTAADSLPWSFFFSNNEGGLVGYNPSQAAPNCNQFGMSGADLSTLGAIDFTITAQSGCAVDFMTIGGGFSQAQLASLHTIITNFNAGCGRGGLYTPPPIIPAITPTFGSAHPTAVLTVDTNSQLNANGTQVARFSDVVGWIQSQQYISALQTNVVISRDDITTTTTTTISSVFALLPRTVTNSTDSTFGLGAGVVCVDTNYVYVSVATNRWKRAALSAW